MSKMQNNIPDLVLERFLLGELPDDELKILSGRLSSDEVLKKRLEQLKSSNREILQSKDTDAVVQAAQETGAETTESGLVYLHDADGEDSRKDHGDGDDNV